MVKNDGKLFTCEECGFSYAEKSLAEKCENYCKTHGACSMEITKHAIKQG